MFFVKIIRQFDFIFQILSITAIFTSYMKKNILIIDNYDSFTSNLHHLVAKSRPDYRFTILRNENPAVFDQEWDSLIISPGPKGPADTGLLKKLFEEYILPEKIPVLGVCLGMQFLAWYYGLTVSPSSNAVHGRTVLINSLENDIFSGIKSPFKVVRYNSLAINESKMDIEKDYPFVVTAWEQKNNMVMAFKHINLPFCGVQFHPESFLTENGELIISNFFRIYLND